MTLIQALKTGLPIKRKGKLSWTIPSSYYSAPESQTWGWFDPEYFLSCVRLTKEDILAKDWQVKRMQKKKGTAKI